MLTPSQISQLNKIIDARINGFIVQNISSEALTPSEIKTLESVGIDVSKIQPKDRLVFQSFALGIASGAVPKNVLNGTSYEDFKRFITDGKLIPLHSYEKGVIRSLERQSISDVRGIGERYKKTLEGAIISSERKYYEDTIRRNIQEGKAKKESLRVISNNIAKELDAFGRSFDKAVQFISHQAFTEGRTAFIERNYGEDAECYFQVYGGACSVCIKSYLTAGIGSEPKVFKVRELPPPNVNFGVKQKDQVTTDSPRHVQCRCHKMPKPSGYEWNKDTQSFQPPKDYKRKVERKSKVKITFGDKEYEV